MAHSQYLTFEEYKGYGGELTETAFRTEEFKARKRIDHLTASRVQAMESVPEAVKMAVFTLMQLESKIGLSAQLDNPMIASFNTDGYSESYGSVTDQVEAASKSAMASVKHILDGELDDNGVPLLYRGLDL